MKSQKIAILEKARITFYSWWISDAYTNTNHSSSSVKGTSIYTQRRCTEDRSARTGLSSLLVVFRSTRRNDHTKQLLRFGLSPPVDPSPIEFSWMTKHLLREPVPTVQHVSIRSDHSIRDETSTRREEFSRRDAAHFCGSKVKLELRLPFLPSSTIDGGSICAFRRSNRVVTRSLCRKIYA